MNKDEFLRQLELLLSDVSLEERMDAMAYYRSYFEDAGEGNEASIIEELESPQKVAESIKRDLGMVAVSGERTHFYNSNVEHDEEFYRNVDEAIYNMQREKKNDNVLILVLGITLAVFTSPIWLGIFSVLFGIAVSIVVCMAAFFICGIIITSIGVACLCGGSVVLGFGLIGGGLIVLSLGMLALVLNVWFFGSFLPWVCRAIYSICKRLFGSRRERETI